MIDVNDLVGKSFDEYNCRQLCLEIMQRAGLPLFSNDAQSEEINDIRDAMQHAIDNDEFVSVPSPQSGCIVAIMMVPPWVDHIGIMIDKYTFIHSTEQYGVCCNRIDEIRWERRIAGYYLYRPQS